MIKGKSLITVLVMTLLMTFATSSGIFAAVATDTVSSSATENDTLYYDSSSGVMYSEVDGDGNGTTVYSGQSDKWSVAYSNETKNYVLTLKGFSFTTSAPDGLAFLKDTTVCLAQGTTNTITSTYNGDDGNSSAILALSHLTIYSSGNGTGELIAQGGTCDNSKDYYSDGIFCPGTLDIISGYIKAYGGADADSIGIETFTFLYFSGDIIAKGGDSISFLPNDLIPVINYLDGALFYGGSNSQSVSLLSVGNNSTDNTLFDNYPYLHIYQTLSDVPYNAWYYENILALYGDEIITGYPSSDGLSYKICPTNTITRAEFVTIIARIFKSENDLEQYAGKYAFTDVPSWASKYVGWAATNGYVNGLNGTHFGSGDNITREQMAAILCRIVNDMKLTANSSNPAITFTDEGQIDDYALNAVRAMQQSGVINGYSNGNGTYSFNPIGQATRAEAFTMIYNFHNAYLNN